MDLLWRICPDEIERFRGEYGLYVLYNNHRPPRKGIDKEICSTNIWSSGIRIAEEKHYYASGKRLRCDDVWVDTNSNSDPLAAQRNDSSRCRRDWRAGDALDLLRVDPRAIIYPLLAMLMLGLCQ